jgi:hypothetical protein
LKPLTINIAITTQNENRVFILYVQRSSKLLAWVDLNISSDDFGMMASRRNGSGKTSGEYLYDSRTVLNGRNLLNVL